MASAKLALRKATISYSTVTASTSLVSSINTRTLTYSTLSGSSINATTLFVNGTQITSGGGSSQWSTIGSNISYSTGNVGIGSTTPQYKLDVAGSVNVTGGFYVNGSAFTSGGGGIIVPNTTSLGSSTWTANSVNWTVSSSTNYTGYDAYKAFNNSVSTSWNTASAVYTTTGNSSGATTTIQGGVGSVQGDYIQLQSSTPLVMYSYQLATGGGAAQFPNTFYIIGSTNGTTWYPIQKSVGVAQTNTAASTFIPGTIIVATSGSQTFGNSSLTTTTYSTTSNAYTYFRLIGTNTYGTNSYLEIGEWYVTFTAPSSSGTSSQWSTIGSNISYTTGSVGIGTTSPQYAMDVAGSVNVTGGFYVNGTALTSGGGIIVPNTSGLASSTWTANNVNWTVSASTNLSGYNPYRMFNNTPADSWANTSTTYTTTGNSTGITTTIQGGIGSIQGDWVQLQSSIPLVMYSYQLATGGGPFQIPNTFYIIGSMDGTTWYPIQKSVGVAQTNTAYNTYVPGTIIVATSGSQTFGNSSLTTTTYSTTSNAYTYFRIIGTNTYGTNSYLEIGEWYVTFTAPSTSGTSSGTSSQWSTIGSTISYTGNVGIGTTAPQYAMDVAGTVNVTGGLYVNGAPYSLGGGIIVPNTTGLSSNTWSTTNGITWISSCSPSAASAAYAAFNNTHAYGQNWLGQLSPAGQYNSSGNYIGSASTTVLGGIGAVSGEWVQIQSSFPLTLYSYIFAVGSWQAQQKTMYVVGSNNGSSWYPLQLITLAANPFTTDFSKAKTSIIMNYAGTQTITADTTQNATTTTYSYTTQTFTYFRFITTANYLTWQDCGQVGELYLAFTTPSSASTATQWTTSGNSISYAGNVGIGISSPTYKLHIGTMDNTYNLSSYLGSGGVGNYGGNLTNSTSLYIIGWGMSQAAWGVTSDRRIKTNIESVTNMLEIIDRVNVVKYDYIDPRLGREECSVIAQELNEVFPNAINVTTDFITNIMKQCTHTRDSELITLHVSLNDNHKDIRSGGIMKLVVLDTTPEKEITTTIHAIDIANNIIVVSAWDDYSPESRIFVYGTEVNDFLSIDKPQLGVMALQGVKELHQVIRLQEERIVRLEALIASLTA